MLRWNGDVEHLQPSGRLLGVLPDIAVAAVPVALGPGDCCILYTDGATDVRGPGGVFGEQRFADVIAGCRGLGAHAIASSIEHAVIDFQGDVIGDDLALVVIGVPPRGAGQPAVSPR